MTNRSKRSVPPGASARRRRAARAFRRAGSVAGLLLWALSPGPLGAQDAPLPCEEVDGFHRLDFWVGEWDVRVEGRSVGSNRIEKILNGCAILEHWRGAGGGEGKSLFYHDPVRDEWKQVWVTGRATRTGGLKEKRLVERLEGGGVRFQGEIPTPDGAGYLDRTTLTPLDGGRVRQLIEVSGDGGETWRTTFDAVYVPVGRGSGGGHRDDALDGPPPTPTQ